ncbi:MAG: dihydropteroate synthase [Candidatus Eisenbacteria bacterium]
MIWRCREHAFDLTSRTLVMGIVNVTPDSFSDGGRYHEPAAAVSHARSLLAEGADLLDLGGESTRPGSLPVSADEQWRRLAPVFEGLHREAPDACLSVDTSSAEVARRALAAGCHVVNDITALGDPDMAGVVADAGAGLVLMHMQGNPAIMQNAPRYDDVVREVGAYLAERLAVARAAGIPEEAIAFDPGVGFGKSLSHSHALLANLDRLSAAGRPVLVGVSRKSFIGRTLPAPDRSPIDPGRAPAPLPVDQRLEGGLAATAVAVLLGARIVRTHDVTATRRAVGMAEALKSARRGS